MKYLFSFFFLATAACAGAQTFTSSPNQAIPDNQTETAYALNVSGLPSTIDSTWGLEQVCVSINHTWDSDLQVRLQSPAGTTVTLFSGVGGSDDNFTNTCFRGDVAANIGSGSAPFSGTYLPAGLLGTFNNGQNPNGQWKLLITDMAAQDAGTLLNWKITFGGQPALAFAFVSSNLPIIKINTGGQTIPNDPKILAHMQVIYNGVGVRNYTNQTDYYYEGDLLVEVQGYSGSTFPKVNYDFELVDANGASRDTNLLGMSPESDWILKTEWTDPSLMKNALTYEMARRMGMYAPHTQFCEVLLNGEYMGMYTLTEKVKRDAHRVDIAKLTATDISGAELTGGYIIEMNINGDPPGWNSVYPPSNSATSPFAVEFKHVYPKADVIQPQQHDYIKAFTDSFENALYGPQFQDPTLGFRHFADENSFIDFCIVDEFSANYDSYGRSTYMYKEKVTDGNKLHIGPVWDYDRAYDSDPAGGWVYENTHPYWPFPFWWMRFRDDSVYMKKLYCRYHSLRGNTLAVDSFYAYVDSAQATLQESYDRNLHRWPDLGSTDLSQHVDDLKSFIAQRLVWMDQNIVDPDLQVPVLSLNDTTFCVGSVLELDAGPQYGYIWSTGSDSSSAVIMQSGTYSVTATDVYGCTATDYFTVDVSAPDAQFGYTQVTLFNFTFSPADTDGQQWLWDFGDGNTSTTETPNHTYSTLGNHSVSLTLTNAQGCSATYTQQISVQYAGVAENGTETVGVYPNPFQAEFTLSATVPIRSLKVYGISGQCLETVSVQSTHKTINLAHLKPGTYFLKIETDEQTITQKIVKQ